MSRIAVWLLSLFFIGLSASPFGLAHAKAQPKSPANKTAAKTKSDKPVAKSAPSKTVQAKAPVTAKKTSKEGSSVKDAKKEANAKKDTLSKKDTVTKKTTTLKESTAGKNTLVKKDQTDKKSGAKLAAGAKQKNEMDVVPAKKSRHSKNVELVQQNAPSKSSLRKKSSGKDDNAKVVTVRGKNGKIIALRAPKNSKDKQLALDTRPSRDKSAGSYKKVALRYAEPVAPRSSFGDLAGLKNTYDPLSLKSNAAFVLDESSLEILFEKNANIALPMASVTKLMTGLVVVESMQDMNEILEITNEDVDTKKFSSSRLRVGTRLTRANMLHLALMSSENRAASALGRNYPGGLPAFINAMNIKAQMLGMSDSRYVDSSGLSSGNVASARDLAKLVMAAAQHPILRKYSTDTYYSIYDGLHELHYGNTNGLVHNPNWQIQVQKTGYISEAGQCLVMQAVIRGRPVVMVFLDSKGKGARIADAQRVRNWLTRTEADLDDPHI